MSGIFLREFDALKPSKKLLRTVEPPKAFYSLPRSDFVSNILLALLLYVSIRQVYRIYATRSVSAIIALISSTLGALVHRFRVIPERLAVSATVRRLGVDDEAATLKRIASWNAFAAFCGLIALGMLLVDAMDALEGAGLGSSGSGGTSSSSGKVKVKKDKAVKEGESGKKE